MKVAVAVLPDGMVNPHFGRAEQMGFAQVENGNIIKWDEVKAPFAEMHGDHGHHHHSGGHHHHPNHKETIKSFLVDHGVDAILVHHAGPGLQKVKDETEIKIFVGAQGVAKQAIKELMHRQLFE